MKETDRDRLYAAGEHHLCDFSGLLFVERDEGLTPCSCALIDLECPTRRRQRLRALKEYVVRLRPVAARDLIHVACTTCDNESRGSARALDGGVDGDRRSMDEALDHFQVEAGLAHAIQHTGREMGRGREALCLVDLTRVGVERQQVCECAANIDGNAQAFQEHSPSLIELKFWP